MKYSSLQKVLWANALFSTISGMSLTMIPSKISSYLGIENTIWLAIIGFGLLVFAIYTIAVSLFKKDSAEWNYSVSIQDFIWVLASGYVMIQNPFMFSSTGLMIVGIVALVVLVFGVLQIVTFNSVYRADTYTQ